MLEPSADEIRDWGNSVTQFMIDYLGGLRDRPAYRHTSSREIRSGLDSEVRLRFGSVRAVDRHIGGHVRSNFFSRRRRFLGRPLLLCLVRRFKEMRNMRPGCPTS